MSEVIENKGSSLQICMSQATIKSNAVLGLVRRNTLFLAFTLPLPYLFASHFIFQGLAFV
jgi:hypothetical protein